ncbi:NAD(P)-dependent oxidoreductase [Solwaraspora sp. WMMD1047]|uniref:NAD(P)-dependent oxidoreductase n=1 Tax=Solwaraspora sp. WMMD1047 TaxID=3016102 RepID=UPI002416C75C|nr:NAD(P)-dependent oxidoreductase [Solwaraspora sp. WMMD1047]MDG4830563.1 NAD(P)-dependent oxidoreductase [Solwaraspora sp. WMMD1047]
MTSSTPTLGWLGTGRMGAAMAGRLLDAGHPVAVWNRTRAKAEPLAGRGATVVDQITDLVDRDIVFVMVSTPDDLREVLLGGSGLLSRDSGRPGTVVDCSTVSAEVSAEVRAAAAELGVEFLAAPVSGNPHVVAEGGASLVASGGRATFDRAEPFLAAIGRTVVYAGPDEQSRLVKLCHNLYLGMVVESLVEVVTLAEKGGVDRAAFLEFLNGTVLASDWVRKRTPDLISRDWNPTFTTALLRKDFDLGLGAARANEVPMPVGSLVHQLIQVAIGRGFRDRDFLAMYDVQAAAAGLDPDGSGAAGPAGSARTGSGTGGSGAGGGGVE